MNSNNEDSLLDGIDDDRSLNEMLLNEEGGKETDEMLI